jgi:2-methylcitrate dehydratase PrpD
VSTTATAANPYTRGLAAFVAGLRYEQIPEDVRHRIKLLILDSLGCALYGVRMEWTKILIDTLTGIDATRTCSVWGTPAKLSGPHAALVNGTAVQGFELDDVHRYGVLHVGAVTLPPLFALIDSAHLLDGRAFLTSAVAGYEVGPRVGMCMGQEHIGQGWHSGATVGVFSAAAGAARALGLDERQTVHALGIGGTQAAGLMAAQYGAMVKRMHAGRAAQSGLYGALFAANGFTGIETIFESEYGGFCTTFSRSTDRFDLEELTGGLGERWETLRISLKFYSCVASNHTTLDAVRSLQAKHKFTAGDVETINVAASHVTVEHAGWIYEPNGLVAAQLNLPFSVATLLIEGDAFVDEYTEAACTDPARMALAKRVRVVEDPAITALGRERRHYVRVHVELKDGRRLEETCEIARGSDKDFASDAQVIAKFEKLAGASLPREKVTQLRDAVLHLDEIDDARRVARLLA